MKFFKRKGRLLRLRPGPLANFSGGAGYMPFITMYSVQTSILFVIVSSIVLFFKRRALGDESDPTRYSVDSIPMHKFVNYVYVHIAVCVVLTIVVGLVLFVMGESDVYGSKMHYAVMTFVFAVGPLIAALLSMLYLVKLLINQGAKWLFLLVGLGIHILLLIALLPIFWIVTFFTEISA
jgi:hypothetical protein